MKFKLRDFIFLPFLFFIYSAGIADEGKSLFVENCAICHTIGKGKLIGPDLKNIHQKRTFDYFKAFVKNSQDFIESGDSLANAVFKEYDESIMPQQNLSTAEVDSVWNFISSFQGDESFDYVAPAPSQKSSLLWLWIVVALVLITFLSWLGRNQIKPVLLKLLTYIPFANLSVGQWKMLLGAVIVLLVLLMINSIGIFTGYRPHQPIQFMHDVHTQQNKISCKYCHYNAYKGAYGGIPSLMTCMNCHKYVNKGTRTDTVEIAKLYQLVGFNPGTKEFHEPGEFSGWNKVYNLPDHARFNHQIHTDAGIDCKECHGDVEQMSAIKQAESLSMKWCIDCHTKKEVPMVGYFSEGEDSEDEYHMMSAEERTNYTLKSDTIYKKYDQLGGLACYRCHY